MKTLNKIENTIIGKILIVVIPNIMAYVGYISIKETTMETFIMQHKIFIVVILLTIHIISLLWLYENFKNKIKALKKYRDYEAIRVVNQYNANFNLINAQIKELYKKCCGSVTKETASPIDEKNTKENQRLHDSAVDEYNKAFEGCGLKDYGVNELSTIKKMQ
ncbi:MAG: hypothetical protein HXX09_07690 [Bacteroidetes bacterium]|nr:hypothetical protein [Bacteroidota bacterium]